jgi:hypothetical protein
MPGYDGITAIASEMVCTARGFQLKYAKWSQTVLAFMVEKETWRTLKNARFQRRHAQFGPTDFSMRTAGDKADRPADQREHQAHD